MQPRRESTQIQETRNLMGQGYATTPRQHYVPARPVEPEDQALVYETGNEQNGLNASTSLKKPARQRQFSIADDDKRRHSSMANAKGHEPGHDGEWMYNLDQLASEHKRKK